MIIFAIALRLKGLNSKKLVVNDLWLYPVLQLAGHFMVPFSTSGHLMVLPKSDCRSPSYEGMRVTAKENGQLMLPVWTPYGSSDRSLTGTGFQPPNRRISKNPNSSCPKLSQTHCSNPFPVKLRRISTENKGFSHSGRCVD